MKNNQKGFLIPLLIIIVAALVVGASAYVYTKNKSSHAQASAITSDQAIALVSNLPEVKAYMKLFSGPDNTSLKTGGKVGISVDSATPDGYVVWVFEDMPDHTATFARYDVDASSGKVTKETIDP